MFFSTFFVILSKSSQERNVCRFKIFRRRRKITGEGGCVAPQGIPSSTLKSHENSCKLNAKRAQELCSTVPGIFPIVQWKEWFFLEEKERILTFLKWELISVDKFLRIRFCINIETIFGLKGSFRDDVGVSKLKNFEVF